MQSYEVVVMKKVLLLMILVLFVAGCGPDEPGTPTTGEVVGEPGLEPETDESVVAVVNGEEIYQSEVDEIQQMQQQQGMPVEEGMIIEQLVEMELLLQEAKDRGLSVSDDEVKEELEELLQMQGMSVEEAEQMLGPQFETLIEEQKQQMLIHKLIDDEFEGPTDVTDEEKQEVFDQLEAMGQIPEGETYDEVEGELEMMLEQEQEQQAIMGLLQELEEEADVDIKVDIQPQQPEMEIEPVPEEGGEEGPQEIEVEPAPEGGEPEDAEEIEVEAQPDEDGEIVIG